MDQKVKIRLLLVVGTIMFIMTVFIVLYGFKRTEELRAEADVVSLMAVPKKAAFGGNPVGLMLGAGSAAEPGEDSAEFDDGMVATLVGIEERQCVMCAGQKELLAVIKLRGGNVPDGTNSYARISPVTAAQWADFGYLFSLLDIGTGHVVFSVDAEQQ